MLTEDQIEELRDLQKELRVQAQITEDAWDNWVAEFEAVATELHKYNDLLANARSIMAEAEIGVSGELGDGQTEIDLDRPSHFDEADAIEEIIEEEIVSC